MREELKEREIAIRGLSKAEEKSGKFVIRSISERRFSINTNLQLRSVIRVTALISPFPYYLNETH